MDRDGRRPVLEETIEQALAPYRGVLPDDVVEEMAAVLREMLPAHPVTGNLIDRLGGRP